MPGLSGSQLYQRLQIDDPRAADRFLFMTGDITERAQKLIAACKCNFLRKPFDLRDMTDAVAALSPRVRDQTA